MIDSDTAAENLRVIRNLMERATLYRAVSAPTAVFGAILVIPVALGLALTPLKWAKPLTYYGIWIAVLFLVGVFNTILLARDARRRDSSMITSSFLHAMRAIVPCMLAGGIISLALVHDSTIKATLCWVVFYGLALLSTQGFAPNSMTRLGGAFVVTGLLLWGLFRLGFLSIAAPFGEVVVASWIMGGTFGLMHLVYGIIVGRKTGFRPSQHEKA